MSNAAQSTQSALSATLIEAPTSKTDENDAPQQRSAGLPKRSRDVLDAARGTADAHRLEEITNASGANARPLRGISDGGEARVEENFDEAAAGTGPANKRPCLGDGLSAQPVAEPAQRAAAGGTATTAELSSEPAAHALAPSASVALAETFLASPTDAAAAALLAVATVPLVEDTDGLRDYSALTQIVSAKADGKLGREELTDILKGSDLLDASQGLSKGNPELAKRFFTDSTLYEKKLKKYQQKKGGAPALSFPDWQRAVIIRLLEMLASRAAAFVNESSTADANAKWDAKEAAAEASRAALVVCKPDDYKIKVLKSLEDSAVALEESGRPPYKPLFALSAEAEVYFPNGSWTKKKEKGVLQKERFDAFKQKLQDYAARAPADEELVTMVRAHRAKTMASADCSEASRQLVHAAQLAAGASFRRPPPLYPVFDEAGRARKLAERAALEALPQNEQACDLGLLSPRHNDAVDASIRESGPLPKRALTEGQSAHHQMFYRACDLPKPKTAEKIVADYRLSNCWNGSEWTSGGAGEASRDRAAARRARGGTAAPEPDADFDPDL